MPSILSTTTTCAPHVITLLALLIDTASTSSVIALPPLRMEARDIAKRATPVGCYSSSAGLSDRGTFTYQSSGHCQPICQGNNQAVFAMTGGNDCLCGDTLPPASSKVSDSQCNMPCNGYPSDICGGTGFYSVYLTGTEATVPNYGGSSSSSSSSSSASSSLPSSSSTSSSSPSSTSGSSTSSASVVTSVAPDQTVVVTMPASQQGSASQSPSAHPSGRSPNVGGIAAGVVVGVLAAAAIIAAIVFYIRHRRRQAAEEEYKRSTQVADFMRGTNERKPPHTGYSTDSRLDPEAGARRNSAGSIADDQDFSRRILRVANPDGH